MLWSLGVFVVVVAGLKTDFLVGEDILIPGFVLAAYTH